MIEYFDEFGEEDWVKIYTESLKELIANERKIGNRGKVLRTFNGSFNYEYFYMTDKFGHTTFYRMTERDFWKEFDRKDNNKDWSVEYKGKEHIICGKCDRCKTCDWCSCNDEHKEE